MSDVLLHSRRLPSGRPGVLVSVTRQRAGWDFVRFAVRRVVPGTTWTGRTGHDELCLVLLSGGCRIRWSPGPAGEHRLGPRESVFDAYPHAVYLPPATRFELDADDVTEIAECRAVSPRGFPARLVGPSDCGYEIRGGGNASRQIIDILPPAFPAGRLLICEVYTPGGNWSSYPPHKHDTDDPPAEADLEEVYYYCFREAHAFGLQRLYDADGRRDVAVTVRDGDAVIVREGYHPFVTAFGCDAYYLNVLAGPHRSMAARDDPRYASVRARWPAPDPRLPLVPPPG